MVRESAFRLLLRWLRGDPGRDPGASNERIVQEVMTELDGVAKADGAARTRVAKRCLLDLRRCGPFASESGYVRYLLACARALSGAGLLVDVPDLLRAGLANLNAGSPPDARDESPGARAVQEVLDDLDPVAAAIREGRVAGPELGPGDLRDLRELARALFAIPYRAR